MAEQRPGRAPRAPAPRRRPGTAIRRLPLASLRVFVAVAEHLSFTRAADALGVTTSAAKVREGLANLERALDEARAERGVGPLRVTMLASFLGQWLMPRLAAFSDLHPRIDLQIHTSTTPVDFARTGFHAGIRFGAGTWPHLHVEKLLDEWLVPVCRPALLKKHGPVMNADDLKRYRLMHSTSEPWSTWLFNDAALERWPSSGIAFDDSVAIIRATEAGQGLALARWSLVADDVLDGRLAVASPRTLKFFRSYYFVCPPAHAKLDKVEAFRRWVQDEARHFAAPPGVTPDPRPDGSTPAERSR